MSHPVVFLDRDGTLNVDSGHVHRWDQWQFVPNAIASLQRISLSGYLTALVTNQAGVALAMYSRDDVESLHQRLQCELAMSGVQMDAIAYCPHDASELCGCRKPNTGLAQAVEKSVGAIDYTRSWMIGDKLSDLGFGVGIGARTVLLRSRYWVVGDPESHRADAIADSLDEATAFICELLCNEP